MKQRVAGDVAGPCWALVTHPWPGGDRLASYGVLVPDHALLDDHRDHYAFSPSAGPQEQRGGRAVLYGVAVDAGCGWRPMAGRALHVPAGAVVQVLNFPHVMGRARPALIGRVPAPSDLVGLEERGAWGFDTETLWFGRVPGATFVTAREMPWGGAFGLPKAGGGVDRYVRASGEREVGIGEQVRVTRHNAARTSSWLPADEMVLALVSGCTHDWTVEDECALCGVSGRELRVAAANQPIRELKISIGSDEPDRFAMGMAEFFNKHVHATPPPGPCCPDYDKHRGAHPGSDEAWLRQAFAGAGMKMLGVARETMKRLLERGVSIQRNEVGRRLILDEAANHLGGELDAAKRSAWAERNHETGMGLAKIVGASLCEPYREQAEAMTKATFEVRVKREEIPCPNEQRGCLGRSGHSGMCEIAGRPEYPPAPLPGSFRPQAVSQRPCPPAVSATIEKRDGRYQVVAHDKRVGEYLPGERVTLTPTPHPAEHERVKVVEQRPPARGKPGLGDTLVDREDGRGRFSVPASTPAKPTVDQLREATVAELRERGLLPEPKGQHPDPETGGRSWERTGTSALPWRRERS